MSRPATISIRASDRDFEILDQIASDHPAAKSYTDKIRVALEYYAHNTDISQLEAMHLQMQEMKAAQDEVVETMQKMQEHLAMK